MPPIRRLPVLVVLLALPGAELAGQVEGSLGHTLGGAALGAYSGYTLGLIGGLLPCNRTADGRRCVVTSASTGSALGLAMGGMIGSQNKDALATRWEGAAIGTGVGMVLGLGLSQVVPRYGWQDMAAVAAIGGAVGASPHGALLGTGAGLVAGGLVWVVVPDAGVQDFVAFTVAGLALGGMVDWLSGAHDKQRTGYTISFSIVP